MKIFPHCLRQVSKLEASGETVAIYLDAEEDIQQHLFRHRIEKRIGEIRSSVETHPLRKGLLKYKLLPYQLDGIAFAIQAVRAILADDKGLGKTIQRVGTAELLASEVRIRIVLVAAACGELLGAVFQFLGELFAEQQPNPAATKKAVSDLRSRLFECAEEDGDGRQRLTIALANKGSIDNLAQMLAKLLVSSNG